MNAQDLSYDPARADLRSNPYPLFARLQEEDPVHYSKALRAWIFTRYDDVREATVEMSADRLSAFYASLHDARRELLAEAMRYLNQWMVFRGPPEHTRIRKLMNGVFTAGAIEALRPDVQELVDSLLDELPRGERLDLVARLSTLVPGYVILDMLGIPRADFARIKSWSDDMRIFIGSARGEADRYERVQRGAHAMAAYFRALVAQRRAEPGPDFTSRMIAAWDGADGFSEDALVGTLMLMLFGGHETTASLISSAVNALLDFPAERERLAAQPELIESAVEEFLRYDGPTSANARIVVEEHALHGKTLRKGERVFAMVGAANRDPRRFERPQELDLGRHPNRHLTFGQGIHFCLGAPLARLEAQVCLGALVQRFPRMRRAEAEPTWMDAMVMRGMATMPVRLG